MDPANLDPSVAVTPDLVHAVVHLVRALGPWPFVALVLGWLALKRVDVLLAHLARRARNTQRKGARREPAQPEPEEPEEPEEPKEPK